MLNRIIFRTIILFMIEKNKSIFQHSYPCIHKMPSFRSVRDSHLNQISYLIWAMDLPYRVMGFGKKNIAYEFINILSLCQNNE